MKKLSIVCLLVLTTSAFSQDMLGYVKGKWKVDVAATKKLPEIKKALADEEEGPMINMMIAMLGLAVFEFTKDSLNTEVMGKKESSMPFTVVENTKTKLIMQNSNNKKQKTMVTKLGKSIIKLEDISEKKGPEGMLPMVLIKAK